MNEFSPMIVVLLVPMSLFVLAVGRIALGTALGYRRGREQFDASGPVFEFVGTPELIATETAPARGRYLLRCLGSSLIYPLPRAGSVRVGRSPSSGGETLVVDAPTVSADHAEITANGDAMLIRNMSRFGTEVNDRHLTGDEECTFGHGDELRFGDELFRCEERGIAARSSGAERTPPPGAGASHRDEDWRQDGDDDDDGGDGIKVHWVR